MVLFVLSCIAFSFLLIQLINALLNSIFTQRLPHAKLEDEVLISVLIPARNEVHNIGMLLEDLLLDTTQNIEIIVCDDASTDGTAEVVRSFIARDARVQLIVSAPLPSGWFGKNHACHQLALAAKGSSFLFLDADVRITPTVIADAVTFAKKNDIALLSLFPQQQLHSWGEKATVPLMNYILITMLPLVLIHRSPFAAHAAANGQCMLFNGAQYLKQLPHQQWRNAAVEDIAIASHYKKEGLTIAGIANEKRVQCRMYHSYKEALEGFSKNIFMLFGGYKPLAFMFWIFATFGFIPVMLYKIAWLPIYIALMVIIQILYAKACRQKGFNTVIYFPLHLFFMMHVMVRAIQKRRHYQWKGREVY